MDNTQAEPRRRREYDPLDTIDRPDPQVSPLAALVPGYAGGGAVGYANGGGVDDQQQSTDATGYVEPQRERTVGSTLRDSLDWLHRQFNIISEARAEATPQQQTGYGTQPNREEEWKVHTPPAPYEQPAAGGSGTTEGMVPKQVPGVAAAAPDSPLGRRAAEQAATPPVSPDDSWATIAGQGIKKLGETLPGPQHLFMGDSAADAARKQFQGTESWWGRTTGNAAKTITDMINGDRPNTLPQLEQLSQRMYQNPTVSYDREWQQTYDEAVKTKGAAGGAEVLQAARPFYDRYNSLSHAALQNNNPEQAAFFADQAHDLLPNNTKQTTVWDKATGTFTVSLADASGQPKVFKLTPDQFYQWRAGNASQFDHVAAGGTERALQLITNPTARAPGSLPQGYSQAMQPDGRVLYTTPTGEQTYQRPGGPPPTAPTGMPPGSAPLRYNNGVIDTGNRGRDYATPMAFGTPKERREKEAVMRAELGRPRPGDDRYAGTKEATLDRNVPQAMRFNVEANIPGGAQQTGNWGTMDNRIKVQEMIDKSRPKNVRDVQNIPVDKLAPEEVYTEQQRMFGGGDERAEAARQQFQRTVAPGQPFLTAAQREQAARNQQVAAPAATPAAAAPATAAPAAQPAATAPAAQPAAGAQPQAQQFLPRRTLPGQRFVAPPQPQTVPPGAQWSPSRQMWRSPDGHMFDVQGRPVNG